MIMMKIPLSISKSKKQMKLINSHLLQQHFFVFHAADGLVVTVSMHHHPASQSRRRVAGSMLSQEFWQQERLMGQALRLSIIRKQIDEFVTKDRNTTRFEADDGDAGFDFGGKFVEDLKQEDLGAVEHAVVVERASAAEVGFWDDDSEARGFEDFDGGFGGAGVEVVIKRVRPEEDGRGSLRG